MQKGKTMEDDKEKYDEEEIKSCEHDRAYYFERAVARKRKKKLKRRRRRMVIAAAAVILTAALTAFLIVSAASGCSGKNNEHSATMTYAQTKATEQSDNATEPAKATKPETSQKSVGVAPSYFDDAVFVGDSITASFQMYVENRRAENVDCLGKAYVLAAASLGYTNSFIPVGDESCVLPVYQGVQQPIEDSIAKIGAKKVYIMLGMNDIAQVDYDTALENAKKVIGNIKAKSPKAKIYIESVTPMVESAQYDALNNEKIRGWNRIMKSFAEENGYYYLDIYSVVADEDGNLREEYCGDPDGMGMHFLMNADEKWEEYLLMHPEGK